MKRHAPTAVLIASLLATGSGAVITQEPSKVTGLIVTEQVSAESQVVAVNLKERRVSLTTKDGGIKVISVGPAFPNLDQVTVGDRVKVGYSTTLTLNIKKGSGIRVTEERIDSPASMPGDKPAVATTREMTLVGDVVSKSPEKGTVTIKGARGRNLVVRVQDPEKLALIQVGDQVDGTYREVGVLDVLPPAARKAKP